MLSPLSRAVLITLAGILGATLGSVSIIYCADLLLDGFTARFDNYAFAIGIPLAVAPLPIYPLAYLIYRMEITQAELARMARTDVLTGVANRRGFFEAAETAFAGRHKNFALMMVDIDHFKRVNDLHGHAAGDNLLRRMAHMIGETVKDTTGIVGRIGGEEFVVFIADARPGHVEKLAERLRRNARRAAFEHDGLRVGATLSIGLAISRPGDTVDVLMKAADMAAYEAKRAGRDRWASADSGKLRNPVDGIRFASHPIQGVAVSNAAGDEKVVSVERVRELADAADSPEK